MRLDNRIAVVTGAASGFGEAIAKRYAAEGARVIVADLNLAGAERVVAEIRQDSGTEAQAIGCDVAKRADVEAMIVAAGRLGGLDILVNNAGYTHRNGPMLDVSEEIYDRIFAVNVKSIYPAALAAVPLMRARRGGVIINTASTAGLRPRPGLTWYNASKGAVITMTKSMAVELAPDRIRVNCLCPVAGETAMLGDFMGQDTPELRAKFIASIPLGRLSTPRDIANAAFFLASDEAQFMTGVALEVDGGRCV